MEITPTHDLLFKKIFASESNKHILKHFIEDILNLSLQSLQILNPYHIEEFLHPDAENIDYTEVDILAQTQDGQRITIELQLANHKSFLERTLYYACKSYVDNYNNPEFMTNRYKYSSLRNTYAINILGFNLFDPSLPTVTHFDFKERETNYLLSEHEMHTITLTYFTLPNLNFNHQKIEFWQKYFTNQTITDAMPEYIQEAKQLANKNNLSKEELKMADMLTKRQEILIAREELVKEEGIEKGREEGIGIGREEGIGIGREKERNELIFNMYENGISISKISNIVDYPEDDIKDILNNYQ